MKKIVFCIFAAAAIVSCGKDDSSGGIPGAGLPELNDTQKQQVGRVNTGIQDMSALTGAQKTNNKAGSGFPNTSNSSETLTKAQEDLVNKLDWAKQYNYCSMQVLGDEMTGDMSQPSVLQLSLTGTDCPVTYSSVTKTTPSFSNNTYNKIVDASEEFKVNPYGIMDLNLEVLSAQTTTKSNVKVVFANEKQMQINANVVVKMTSQSKTAGTVVSEMVMTTSMTQEFSQSTDESGVKNMTAAVTVTQTFSDFKVVAYVVMNFPTGTFQNMDQKQIEKYMTFHINGKKVSATEFAQVFGDIGFVLP